MCAKWINGYDPEVILNFMESHVSVSKDGNLSTGLDYHSLFQHLIEASIEFDASIPKVQQESIVRRGLGQALLSNEFTPDNVKIELSRAEREYLKKKSCDYVLLSSLSFRAMPPIRKIRTATGTIKLLKNAPRGFSRKEGIEQGKRILRTKLPEDYITVKVETQGRNPGEAAENALTALTVSVGVVNFILTRGSSTLSLTGAETGPLPAIALGPIHTLHQPDGTSAHPGIWYEPNYARPMPPLRNTKRYSGLRSHIDYIFRQIDKSPSSSSYRDFFSRYASALSEPNLHTVFLSFWGLLEHLTGTTRLSYDKTIQRASFVYTDFDIARQELNSLRHARNDLIHLGESTNYPMARIYRLKFYVDGLLAFMLSDDNIRLTRDELNEFMDLPCSLNELKRKNSLYGRAISFRNET